MKRFVHKGWKVFAVYIMDDREKNNQLNVEYIPILKDFKDIFLVPPKRDIFYNWFGTTGGTNIKSSISYEHFGT